MTTLNPILADFGIMGEKSGDTQDVYVPKIEELNLGANLKGKINGKLDAFTPTDSRWYIYGVTDTGEQITRPLAQAQAVANSVPQRTGEGQIVVNTPTEDSHTATKAYADGIVSVLGDTTNMAIKYANGVLVCVGRFTSSVTSSNVSQVEYGYVVSLYPGITFRVRFIANPCVTYSMATDSSSELFCSPYGCIRSSTGISRVDMYRPKAFDTGQTTISWMATGMWK